MNDLLNRLAEWQKGVDGPELIECPECCGTGEIDYIAHEYRKAPVLAVDRCPHCDGDGLIFAAPEAPTP